MCTRRFIRPLTVGIAFLCFASTATSALADPVGVSGFLFGDLRLGHIQQELDLAFPGFSISIDPASALQPGYCLGCGDGASVPFTQTTGVFTAHSTGLQVLGTIDADVTGMLSFVGPTETIAIDPVVGGDVLTAPVQVFGFLRITQPGATLFDGTLSGSGLGTVLYESLRSGQTRLGGYQFSIDAVASTPEPASLILVSSGVAWVAGRFRKKRRA